MLKGNKNKYVISSSLLKGDNERSLTKHSAVISITLVAVESVSAPKSASFAVTPIKQLYYPTSATSVKSKKSSFPLVNVEAAPQSLIL